MTEERDIVSELLALEQRRRDALVADDMATFAALLADDLVHVHTTGLIHDKAALLVHAGQTLQFIDVERSNLVVRLLGPHVAVMTGGLKNTVSRRGQDEKIEVEGFATQVWAKRDDVWRIVSFQATRTPPTAAG
jgi:hypothetical protein